MPTFSFYIPVVISNQINISAATVEEARKQLGKYLGSYTGEFLHETESEPTADKDKIITVINNDTQEDTEYSDLKEALQK